MGASTFWERWRGQRRCTTSARGPAGQGRRCPSARRRRAASRLVGAPQCMNQRKARTHSAFPRYLCAVTRNDIEANAGSNVRSVSPSRSRRRISPLPLCGSERAHAVLFRAQGGHAVHAALCTAGTAAEIGCTLLCSCISEHMITVHARGASERGFCVSMRIGWCRDCRRCSNRRDAGG